MACEVARIRNCLFRRPTLGATLWRVAASAGSLQWPLCGQHLMASGVLRRSAPPRRASASGSSQWCGGGPLLCV